MITCSIKGPAIASCVLAAALSIAASGAGAQPRDATLAAISVDALKHVYLECERAAIGGGLRGGDVMHCSIIYEELKRRAFGGDFGRLKAWCDSQLRPLSMSHASVRSA